MTDQANVPLVIVNPARDFTLSIFADRAVLGCPLCAADYLADQRQLAEIPVEQLPGGGTRAVLPPGGAPPLRYRQWEHLTVDDGASLGHLVDLALGHLAEAHPEHLVPAPVGDGTDYSRRAGGPPRSDTLRARRDATPAGVCTGCGCTDDDCSQCIARTGHPCSWVSPTRCSACL